MAQRGPWCLIKVRRPVYRRLVALKGPGMSLSDVIRLLLDIAEPLLREAAMEEAGFTPLARGFWHLPDELRLRLRLLASMAGISFGYPVKAGQEGTGNSAVPLRALTGNKRP